MSGFVAPRPAAHGGDGARLAAALGMRLDEILDLSINLNPCAPDVEPVVAAHAGSVAHYPDVEPATRALATEIGVEPDRVVLTNGGAEAIALVASELPVGDVDECEFSLYARHLREVTAGAPRWRSNPNNPTGLLAGADEHAAVWDEAFYPLATGTWTRADTHSIVVGSLTKLFACPGLRIGYVIAPDAELAEHLSHRQPLWSVSSLACAVIPELLTSADLDKWAARTAELRGSLEAMLRAHDLEPEPSDASFVLVRDAAGLRDHLAARAVLVRDTASFGIPGGVRIAVPDDAGLERLGRALEEST